MDSHSSRTRVTTYL